MHPSSLPFSRIFRNILRKMVIVAATLFSALYLQAQDAFPDAKEVLKTVRIAHTAQDWKFRGRLENRGKKIPFRLVFAKGIMRYEFTDTGDALVLKLDEKDSRLEEIKDGKTERIGKAKFDQKIRETDVTYEDIAMQFLYWPDARVLGSDAIMASACWKLEIYPPPGSETSFGKVIAWIAKEHGGLMKAENYDKAGRLIRRFVVRKVMKRDGAWFLKTMRIENIPPGRNSDTSPTYLEIDSIEK